MPAKALSSNFQSETVNFHSLYCCGLAKMNTDNSYTGCNDWLFCDEVSVTVIQSLLPTALIRINNDNQSLIIKQRNHLKFGSIL